MTIPDPSGRHGAKRREGRNLQMKVVILAGGLGTRISEESHLIPKPMIEIGRKPILWHIMKEYSHYGFHEFIICAGYKQEKIKEYFANYYTYNSDVTFDLEHNTAEILSPHTDPWRVTVVDTGYDTMTGGRVKRIEKYLNGEPFFLTITAVNIAQMKGVLQLSQEGLVEDFREKDENDSTLVNGGYMVLEPEIFRYLKDDTTIFEKEPMARLSEEGQLDAYLHEGFWQCMDTQREKKKLEDLWESGQAPWKTWE